jgi:nucleoside-diphosphate-sugar epimerase
MTFNVLIFGGSSFMGWHLTQLLLNSSNHCVTLLNRGNSYWNDSSNQYESYGDRFNHFKVNDRRAIAKSKSKLQALHDKRAFHFVVDFSAFTPDDISPVVDFCSENDIHYVFISSDSVYEVRCLSKQVSDNVRVEDDAVRPDDVAIRESLRSQDEYGDDKLLCEELMRATKSLRFTALRLPDVFGPRDATDRHWQYQLLVKLALNSDDQWQLPIEPRQRRRLLSGVDARDVAAAILLVFQKASIANRKSFNIAWVINFQLLLLLLLLLTFFKQSNPI